MGRSGIRFIAGFVYDDEMMLQSADMLNEIPTATTGLDLRQAGAETLVHDAVTGRIHVLNAVAALLISHCDGVRNIGALVDMVVDETGADRARVTRDVLAVFADFRAKGLVN